jgi:hypothetical protein
VPRCKVESKSTADVGGGDAENVVLGIIREVMYLKNGNDLGGFLITEIATLVITSMIESTLPSMINIIWPACYKACYS